MEKTFTAKVFPTMPMFEPARDNVLAWSTPGRAVELTGYHDIGAGELERVVCVITGLID